MVRRIVESAYGSDAHLLLPEERAVVERFLALPPAEGHLLARLLHRVSPLFRPDRLDPPDRLLLPALHREGFLDPEVSWEEGLSTLRVPELSALCGEHHLPRSGRKAELWERLLAVDGASLPVDVQRVRHRALFQRMQLLWARDPRRDHRAVILDMLGIRTAPAYTPTPAPPAFPHRASLLAFEEAWERVHTEPFDPMDHLEWALACLRDTPRPSLAARRLSPRGPAIRVVVAAARELERAKAPAEAAYLYRLLLGTEAATEGGLVRRAAIALDAAGDGAEAVELAGAMREMLFPPDARALERTGCRIARRHRLPWDPLPPLQRPPERQLALPGAATGGARPRYRTPAGAVPVEEAVAHEVEAAGRHVLRGESAPWTTLFALLLYDLYWLPVPGMLPVPYMRGPLDLGRPDFALNREAALQKRLTEIAQGAAPEEVERAYAAHYGEDVRGARWKWLDAAELAALCRGLGGAAVARVLERLAREGWRARRGLPDLVILPGEACSLGRADPEPLGPEARLVEVKGPTDQVRDEQAIWFDHLLEAGVAVELWRVRATGPDGASAIRRPGA